MPMAFWGVAEAPDTGTPPDEIAEASDLFAWLEAGEDATTGALNDGDPVVTWEDLHTSNHDYTQGTAGERPVYKTSIVNGLSVVRFDGSNDNLENTTTAPPSNSRRTLIAVIAMAASPVNTQNSVLFVNQIGGSWHFMAREQDANGNVVGMQRASGEEQLTDHVLPVDGSFHIVSWKYHGQGGAQANGAKIWIDGTLEMNETSAGGDVGTSVSTNIGAGTAGSAFKGDIAALAYYDTNISDASIAEVEQYFADKYGITLA